MRISSPPATSASGTEINALRPRPRRRPPDPSVMRSSKKHMFVSLRHPVDELASYSHVRLCANRRDIVKNDRLPEARSLGQPHISGDNRVEHLRPEVLACFGGHLARKVQARIVHRKEHAID